MITVYYHSPCDDGFAAAYAAQKKLGFDGVEYIGYTHGTAIDTDVDEKDEVYFLDMCPDPSVLAVIAGKCKQVTVIDHHLHVQEWVPQILALGVELVFDIEYSGCVLAQGFFNKGEGVPTLFKHIQDRDLWKWEMLDTDILILGLRLRPYEFEVWKGLLCDDSLLYDLKSDGSVLKRHVELQVDEHCKRAALRAFEGHMVPVVNTTQYHSEIGHELLNIYDDAPFAITYRDDGNSVRHYELRSRGDFDVSKVAVKYGGGGHKSSAGFERALGVL